MISNINDRVKFIRKNLNLTQTEFGEKINRSLRAIQNYENGDRSINGDLLLNLQEKFNVNIHWLRTGEGSMFLSDKREESNQQGVRVFPTEKDKYDYVEIPAYLDVKASAGTGAFVGMEKITEMVPVSKKILKNAYGLVILAVDGDSMAPAILNKDKIIIDTYDKYELKKNKVYVIRKDNELYIKRYNDCNSDMYIFTSDNPKYSSVILDKEDNGGIVGRLKGIFMREIN